MSDRAVFEALLEAKRSGKAAVLATVISDRGSVPRHAGAKMLIFADGRVVGTVGGGELESRIINTAPEVLQRGTPTLVHFDLTDPARGDPGVCGGQVDIFLEPIMPDPTILVIGCGHCGQALAELAHWLGYQVIVTDDRADLCNPQAMPYADVHYVLPAQDIARAIPIHERTYIAAVTRNMELDVAMLPGLLTTPAPFIGVMGSRRRWAVTMKKLKEQGISEDVLSRVHAPIGLELNAETPREIAVSIMAEIIAFQRGGTGQPMKWMGTPEDATQTAPTDKRS